MSLAASINAAYADRLKRKAVSQPWAGWRASGLADECERRVYLWRTEGHQAAPVSEGLAAIFEAGTLMHPVLRRLMSELGFEVLEAERGFPANDYGVTGSVDGMVNGKVFECKTCNPADFGRLNTAADLKASERFTRKWYGQIQVYMLLADKPEAVLVLWDKMGGRLKAIDVPQDLEEAQALLDRAARLNAALASKTPPDFHKDPSVCRKCPFFGRACAPPLDYGPGAAILTDDVLLSDLARRQELKDAAGEYERLDKKVKEQLRGVEMGVAGDFLIEGRATKRKAFTVPESEGWTVRIKPLNNGEPG